MTTTAIDTCPQCGAALAAPSGYVRWCPACEWNVDPGGDDEPAEVRRQRRADARGDALYRRVADGARPAGRWSASRALAYAIALGVHATTAAVLAAAVLVAVASHGNPIALGVAALLLLVAWAQRPRLGRPEPGVDVLRREDAPALFDALDAVAARLGAPCPELLQVDDRFNASYRSVGLRRRGLLVVGRPLWWALDDEQRAAMLAHELGHAVNGDATTGVVVGSALNVLRRSMQGWAKPGRRRQSYVVMASQAPFMLVLHGVHKALWRASLGDHQRAEYAADLSMLEAADGPAALGLLDVLPLDASTMRIIGRSRQHGDRRPVRAIVAEHMATMPVEERDRLRRVGVRRGHRADTTHPPTHLRVEAIRRHLERRPPRERPDLRVPGDVLPGPSRG